MADVSGVDNLSSSSNGPASLAGIKSAIDNLNNSKPDSSTVVPNTRQVNGHALSSDVTVTQGDVGLGSVDNTSDATKNAATATLTNKTISGADNTLTVREADLSTSDVTTANVSISKHGFTPKAPNDATKYLDGTGSYSVPVGNAAYANGFGTWGGATADGAGHQVTTDGFLIGYGTTTTTGSLTVKSDSSSTPTTIRQIANIGATSSAPFMIPVRKNDYYLVVVSGGMSIPLIFFIPLT